MRSNPHARLVGRENGLASSSPSPVRKASIGTISEDDLRRSLGVEKPSSKPKIPDSYRQLLNLDPQDIIGFFDVKVGEYTEFAQTDSVVPLSILERRIRRLQRVIACSKKIIEGMASRIIKIRRGKDDPLLDDKATREKYKREENARIARCNVKSARYRAALRSAKDLHERVWRETIKPIYFRDLVDDVMAFPTETWEKEERTPVLTGGLLTHEQVETVEYFRRGILDLDGYRKIMTLGVDALSELGESHAQMEKMWKIVKRWENAIIVQAVRHGVIGVRRDLADLLGLGDILDADDEPCLADATEDALAIKTGGACYGGRIKSEGYRYRNGRVTARALSSFDKPLYSLDGSGTYKDEGFQSLRDVSDDAESYDPR